jgi:hypothetical protein
VESQVTNKAKRNDVREEARKALSQLFQPLAGFVIDAGISANELYSILREAAVRSNLRRLKCSVAALRNTLLFQHRQPSDNSESLKSRMLTCRKTV